MVGVRNNPARQHARIIEARAVPFQRALEIWMVRACQAEVDRLLKTGFVAEQMRIKKRLTYLDFLVHEEMVRLAKAEKDEDEERLFALMMRFGFKTTVDVARQTSIDLTRRDHLPSNLFAESEGRNPKINFFQEIQGSIEERTRAMTATLRDDVRRSVGRLVEDAVKESPAPTASELARRIRTQNHAKDRDRIFGFSSERAETIARTELGFARNSGTFAGYKATGVKEIEWLAITSDFRSGSRKHYKMQGERVKLGEMFTLPSGVKMRYPLDPAAPIGETIQCRCSTRPVG